MVTDLFVCARVLKHEGNTISAIPICFAHQITQGPLGFRLSWKRNELFPDSIDSFAQISAVRTPSKKELSRLRSIPEEDVKQAFAAIIGEPTVPKDWAGETSDLYTTHLRVDGERTSAAFVFKGPAGGKRFNAMTLAHLGKNGDQVVRLATEPAEVLVVQHCHEIKNDVRSVLRAFCLQPQHERRYCLISGYDTYRILKAYGKCGL